MLFCGEARTRRVLYTIYLLLRSIYLIIPRATNDMATTAIQLEKSSTRVAHGALSLRGHGLFPAKVLDEEKKESLLLLLLLLFGFRTEMRESGFSRRAIRVAWHLIKY